MGDGTTTVLPYKKEGGVNGTFILYTTTTLPDGALAGEFSVSATKKVLFSQGNLVATVDATGAPTAWKFAANQYDCIGEGGANKTIGKTAGDVDLFGWSTAKSNYGISTSTEDSDYSGDFVDWGKAIGDGNTWHTLSKDEWGYLLGMELDHDFYVPNTEHPRAEKLGLATVNSVPGLVLLPDIWELPSGCSFTATSLDESCCVTDDKNFALNSYATTEWSQMESAGAVFLPAAGERSVSYVLSVGDVGCYWNASFSEENSADFLNVNNYNIPLEISDRYYGYSVRLVTDVPAK